VAFLQAIFRLDEAQHLAETQAELQELGRADLRHRAELAAVRAYTARLLA